MRGFTLVELIVVIGAAILIAAFTMPVGFRFFQTQRLDEATMNILWTIRRANNQAISQKNDRAYGVKFLPGLYTLFQGDSYALRVLSYDENFDLPVGISVTGIDEVSFSKLNGTPSFIGAFSVNSGSDSQSVNVNVYGKIEKE